MNILFSVETLIAFLIAITLHEAAHAIVATLLGDATPRSKGRLAFNPARQISALGVIIAIVFALSGLPAGMGWGKPVDVDVRHMRVGPNTGLVLTALAGPLINLLTGLLAAFGLTLLPGYAGLSARIDGACLGVGHGHALEMCLQPAQPAYALRIEQLLFAFAVTSIAIALLNIIPLYPLDGYRILYALLPPRQAVSFRTIEPYMEFLLLLVLFLVPYILQVARISFSPGDLIIQGAYTIAQLITGAGSTAFLYL